MIDQTVFAAAREQGGTTIGTELPPHLVAETDAWRFAVYAWGSEKLVLRVVVRQRHHGVQHVEQLLVRVLERFTGRLVARQRG